MLRKKWNTIQLNLVMWLITEVIVYEHCYDLQQFTLLWLEGSSTKESSLMSCLTGLVLMISESQLTFAACGRNREQSNTIIALFPGCSRLQFLIICSMQTWRGKAWEIESCAWRQVDVTGVVPNRCNSQTLSWYQPRVYQTTSCIDAVFRMLQSQVFGQDITRRTLTFFVGHHLPHIYPHVYLTSCMWLNLPGLSPLLLRTASDQKLEVERPWNKANMSIHL